MSHKHKYPGMSHKDKYSTCSKQQNRNSSPKQKNTCMKKTHPSNDTCKGKGAKKTSSAKAGKSLIPEDLLMKKRFLNSETLMQIRTRLRGFCFLMIDISGLKIYGQEMVVIEGWKANWYCPIIVFQVQGFLDMLQADEFKVPT
ncbi:hypothetical protein PGTUg99_028701 [Puccinia graminis f. sp. tritici]|uniref:Uncharacterized protein n=1 Tax=Puccinia graminis f. sp. tritici TaxID=56615 RepID=A0A5B0SKM1_PUCGR|nr:hypothetical protein PGTUg99_028701 [Puccinia graminis f. sp. tritici]